jgi:hypothetical protein
MPSKNHKISLARNARFLHKGRSNAAKCKDAVLPLTTTSVDVVMAETDISAQSPLGKQGIPSYEEQLATIESMMTCYDTPITQAAGYVRDLLRTIIALQQREIPGNDAFVQYAGNILRERRAAQIEKYRSDLSQDQKIDVVLSALISYTERAEAGNR